MEALHGLALCTGAAGLELGLSLATGVRVVAYVEREAAAVECLLARISDRSLDPAPIWDDVSTFDGRPWRGLVDIVTAGFPCQPVSVAGLRRGADDERWLWADIWRIVREVDAGLLFVENVPGLLARNGPFGTVLGALAESGWSAEWDCVPASSVGAPHRRDRVFLLAADSDCGRLESERRPTRDRSLSPGTELDGHGGPSADAPRARLAEWRERWSRGEAFDQRGVPEPVLCGVDDGLAASVDRDRLHVLGNGVVPQAAAQAFRVLAGRLFAETKETDRVAVSPTKVT